MTSELNWLAQPGGQPQLRVGSKWERETIAIVDDNASVIRDNIVSLEKPQMVAQQRETRVHEPACSGRCNKRSQFLKRGREGSLQLLVNDSQ